MAKIFENTFSYKLIYVFGIDSETHKGLLKVGDATINDVSSINLIKDNSDELNKAAIFRIDQYTKTAGIKYKLFYTTLAITNKNKLFRDYDVRDVLIRSNVEQPKKELNGAMDWFRTDLETVKKAIQAVKNGNKSLRPGDISEGRTPIIFRPEQNEAINQTLKQFRTKNTEKETNAHMLWNAKMRFGKTLSALEVVKQMSFNKTLIITHRPVVKHSWYEDFDKIFYDSKTYLYGSKTQGETLKNLKKLSKDRKNSFVYFASIQDLRGSALVGGKFDKNDEIFEMEWDFIIVDEAHEGTQTSLGNEVIQTVIQSTKKTKTLYLSGTPFNLLSPISKQTFKENEVYTWDYVMEQRAKLDWVQKHFGDSNPYESLPKMNIYTYDLANIISNNQYKDVEDTAFNFKEFFRVWTGNAEIDKPKPTDKVKIGFFVYEKDIKSFLDLLVQYGEHNYPFSSNEYRDNFRHTLWMVPGVKEAKALSALMKEHKVFQHFNIVNVAGEGDEEVKSDDALKMVLNAISDKPDETRTITLSCGRLTTGVSVPAWSAVFMLSGSSSTSASSYLQTIFRVQTPSIIGNKMKTNCYVFDFAPDRTLKMVAEAGHLSTKVGAVNDDKTRMGEFLNFCPVIAVDGSEMKPYSTENMLVQLKRALVDRVARNGFDDRHLYNDKLLQLTDVEVAKFQELKKILKASKATKSDGDILINDQGLDAEVREAIEKRQNKKELSPEEKAALEERMKKLRERSSAIAILRGIAIRIPLLVYGADIDVNQRIDVNSFPGLVDDKSWEEFMPKGVTKDKFLEFSQYFDNEVFVEAGLKIRRQAKAADELLPIERAQAIANIFSTFKNPDKETVLTPWRVVNMHIGETLGGANFYFAGYEKELEIDENTSLRWIDQKSITREVFDLDSRILEINSKSGLYPLYAAVSIYQSTKLKGRMKNTQSLWKNILYENIFVVCRTYMAALITKRTLKGFESDENLKVNVIVVDDIVEQMKSQTNNEYQDLINLINKKRTWKRGDGVMKFNAVIGNPPYQENIADRSEQPPIYHLFYDIAMQLSDVVTLITPARFLFNVGKTPTEWNNKMLNDDFFKVSKYYPDSRFIFPTVEIKGGVAVTLRNLRTKYGAIKVFVPNDTTKDILNKVVSKDVNSLGDIIFSNTSYKYSALFFEENPEYKKRVSGGSMRYLSSSVFEKFPESFHEIKPNDGKKYSKIIGRKDSERKYYYFKESYLNVPSNYSKYKVFLASSNGTGAFGEALSTPIVGAPYTGATETFISIGSFTNKFDAENLIKYIKTKFCRLLLSTKKVTQGNKSSSVWENIPLEDFSSNSDIDWSKSILEIDQQLYFKYGLSVNEIEFINLKVKEMK